jgi:hypothetical protein
VEEQQRSDRVAFLGVLGALAALLLALIASSGFALAQGQRVSISQLRCETEPEIIVITNNSSTNQDINGWKLVSDPTETEVLDLSGIGVLIAGESVFIEAGPGASGAFVWSSESVLRDDDATDFVRLVDDAGETVAEMACAQPTPTPSRTTPTPTAVTVPNGGGPPPEAGRAAASLLAVLAGGGLVTAASMAIAGPRWASAAARIPFLRQRLKGSSDTMTLATQSPADNSVPTRRMLAAVGIALLVALLLAFIVNTGNRPRR